MNLRQFAAKYNFSKQDVYRHVLSWLFIVFILHFLAPMGGVLAEIIGDIFIFSNYIIVYYFLSLYALNFYHKRKYLKLALLVLSAFAFYCIYYFLIGKYILPVIGGRSDLVDQPLNLYLRDCTFIFLVVIIAAIAFNINRNSKLNILEQVKKDKLLTLRELNYLKSQFDYHLTFNFFNFLYCQIYKYSIDIAGSIELFCELLRFFLKIDPKRKIELQKEIRCLEQYIELKRHMTTVKKVNFEISGEINNKHIIPGIFIILIEDIFYYNNLNSLINSTSLDIAVTEVTLKFTLNIKTDKQINSIILPVENNVEQILGLFYKNNYKLEFTGKNGINKCILTLNTKNQ